MKKTKMQNGITLIALIITIIVLLILSAVAIVAVHDSGIIGKAKNAVEQHKAGKADEESKLQGYEEFLDSMMSGEDEDDFVITAPEPLLDYILGKKDEATGKRLGRKLSDIFDMGNLNFKEESIPEELKDGNLTVTSMACVSTEIVQEEDAEGNAIYESGLNYDFYFTYENIIYKFRAILIVVSDDEIKGSTLAEAGVKDLSYDTASKVGKYVSYDDNIWMILYDDSENGLQMMSVASSIKLGYEDQTFTEAEVTEIDGIAGKDNLEKAMYSYNKAVTTLNAICEGSVTQKEGVTKGVRSLGSNPIAPNEDSKKAFIGSRDTILLYNEETDTPITWFEDKLNLQLNKTKERIYYTIKGTNPVQEYTIKDTDLNYEKDYDRLVALGVNAIIDKCWLASCVVSSNESGNAFNIRTIEGGFAMGRDLWEVGSSLAHAITYYKNENLCAVCPVVTLEQGVLDNLEGDGLTPETAYQLD